MSTNEAVFIPLHTFLAAKRIMGEVGFPDEDRYGFDFHVTNPESYWPNHLEWSLNELGMKIYVRKNSDNAVSSIKVSKDGNNSAYASEDFARVNNKLEVLFGK